MSPTVSQIMQKDTNSTLILIEVWPASVATSTQYSYGGFEKRKAQRTNISPIFL